MFRSRRGKQLYLRGYRRTKKKPEKNVYNYIKRCVCMTYTSLWIFLWWFFLLFYSVCMFFFCYSWFQNYFVMQNRNKKKKKIQKYIEKLNRYVIVKNNTIILLIKTRRIPLKTRVLIIDKIYVIFFFVFMFPPVFRHDFWKCLRFLRKINKKITHSNERRVINHRSNCFLSFFDSNKTKPFYNLRNSSSFDRVI